MTDKELIFQRICAYTGEIDVSSDQKVVEVLRDKFNIRLPQRKNIVESLKASVSDHEILDLLISYHADSAAMVERRAG